MGSTNINLGILKLRYLGKKLKLHRAARFLGLERFLKEFIAAIANQYFRENSGVAFFETKVAGTRFSILDLSYGSEYYAEKFYRGTDYEGSVLSFLAEKILTQIDSPTFVDIGSHIGYFSVFAGSHLRNGGEVHAIEPNQYYFWSTKKNLELNTLADVKAHNIALSDRDMNVKMAGKQGRDMVESPDGNIRGTTFDQWSIEQDINPDVVKIDVHGAEAKVLLGMKTRLQNSITHILLETHSQKLMHGHSIEEIFTLMDEYGFKCFELVEHRKSTGYNLVPVDSLDMQRHNDRMLYFSRQ